MPIRVPRPRQRSMLSAAPPLNDKIGSELTACDVCHAAKTSRSSARIEALAADGL